MALFAGFVVRDSEPEPRVASNPENPTSEAKFDESAVTIQNEASLPVASNPGPYSPLDKRDMDKRHMQPMAGRGQNKSAQADSLGERENPTSEAKCDENVVTIQNEEPHAVAANPGLDRPLDKRDDPPCGAPGRSTTDLWAPFALNRRPNAPPCS
jgi:hypothetical protein